MKQELVEWEKEEQERRERERELSIQHGQQIVSLADAAREKTTPERVSFVEPYNRNKGFPVKFHRQGTKYI
jgi:hypothetical protein